VKAVAAQESDWRQFTAGGQPFISDDNGIGIMQITNQSNPDIQEKLKNDIYYNIQTGVEILSGMYQRSDLPKIKEIGSEVIENWYFPVLAYNGTKPVNSPLVQSDGLKNTKAYQEKVFARIQQDSFLGDTKLGQFPFTTGDFYYDPNSSNNIVFKKLEYTITNQMHTSMHLYHKGDKVSVTFEGVTLRAQPSSTSSSKKKLAKATPLIVDGDFKYDQSVSSLNKFVWVPVKTSDQKLTGYISSAYISKKLDAPIVSIVDDNDRSLSGKTASNVRIQIMNGTKLIGSTVSDSNGNFKAVIPMQKAGTQLTVAYKDKLNALSPSARMVVIDKTAPNLPTVNNVSNKAGTLTGKTEAYATVTVVIAGKKYSGKADKYGNYKVTIPVQNAGAKLSVTAKDSKGNVSKARIISVIKVAPNQPTVNKVRYTSTTVTGKTEKKATVTVKIGTKKYTAKANASGNYKVKIPKQKAGKKLYVYAKDSKGRVSATRTVTVSK
ncbi:Ig-like domain-containing protein, partial [Neobacillus drentensis]|uniref:Ig-like domain-containing protein n=1 Tax=Neobacillus drentensis TaxID=220684 RepID=UPI0030027576